ncbi:whirlin isoform X7 [Mirounga leonina]|uniref:whirlin isoform X7 n=1 Tax=Mirounga leonina TaxID=9715 RepID=UPI00156C4B13|nr:whirlin isoform X7 [Mirounga leonina]
MRKSPCQPPVSCMSLNWTTPGTSHETVNLVLGDGRSLGLTIRGGAEYGLGIYVTGVDLGSEAESSGLKVGDQILEVNGRSFLNILHDEAVKLLKSSQHLTLTVKDVGRLPHARTTVDETKWIASSRIGDTSTNSAGFPGDLPTEGTNKLGFYKGPAGSQVTLSSLGNQTRLLLEEKARHLLTEQECATMAYYLEEYRGGSISVEALAMALFELLNTHGKFSLLSEVRGTIFPQDLDRFDHLVLRREIESMKARQPPGPRAGDTYSMVSYSDMGSSTGSHGTSTTVSSARERLLWLIDLMENTLDLEETGEVVQGNMNTLPDVSLDDVKASEALPSSKPPPPPPPLSQGHNRPPAQPRKPGKEDLQPPSSASSHSGIVFSAPRNRSPAAGTAPAPGAASAQDSPSSPIYASVPPAKPGSKRPLDAHLALVSQHRIGPFPRVQSPPHLKSPPAEGGCLPPPSPSGQPDAAGTNQHFVMVEVHQPDSEPDVNEVRALPQARTGSTLSQLSDSGQTLSEDSGVDAGEAEASAPGRGRQTAPTKSRSSKEPPRDERTTEGAAKPPGLLEPTSTLVRVKKSAATLGIAIEGGANTRQPLPRIVTIQVPPWAPLDHLSLPLRAPLSASPGFCHRRPPPPPGDDPAAKGRPRPFALPEPVFLVRAADTQIVACLAVLGLTWRVFKAGQPRPQLPRVPLPCVSPLQRGGSAHNCGQLKVGHVILEVNGRTLRGKEHREAARVIAEAFKTKERDYVDFLVTEFNVML